MPLVSLSTHYAMPFIQNSQLLKHSFCCEVLYIHMPNVNTLFCSLYSMYKSDAMLFLCFTIMKTGHKAT